MPTQSFQLLRQGSGALPILDQVLGRIGLGEHLSQAMGQARYAQAILLLLKNIVIERNALYAIQEWAAQYDPALVYGGGYSDDVLARALDRLFETDRASLLTRVVLHSVKAYAVDLGQIHQDTTSVKLTSVRKAAAPRRAVATGLQQRSPSGPAAAGLRAFGDPRWRHSRALQSSRRQPYR